MYSTVPQICLTKNELHQEGLTAIYKTVFMQHFIQCLNLQKYKYVQQTLIERATNGDSQKYIVMGQKWNITRKKIVR